MVSLPGIHSLGLIKVGINLFSEETECNTFCSVMDLSLLKKWNKHLEGSEFETNTKVEDKMIK